MKYAPHQKARMLILIMWRAGMRVSEACKLDITDVDLTGDYPSLRIRQGKGNKTRVTPLHAELQAAMATAADWGGVSTGRIIGVHRTTAWAWVKLAQASAESAAAIPKGRKIGTHTFRHSAARHWLASGVPINVVSRWLGHANLQTTMVYLQILPDPTGLIAKVP